MVPLVLLPVVPAGATQTLLRALEGRYVSSKSPSRVWDRDRDELLEGTKGHSPQQGVIEFAWMANQFFSTIKRKHNRIELVTRPASLCSFPAVACTFQRFRSMQLHAWEMRTALLEACGRFQRRIDSRGGCSCRRGASTLGKLSSPSTGCFCRDVWRYPWQCSVHAAPQWRKGIPFCYPIRPFSASRWAEM